MCPHTPQLTKYVTLIPDDKARADIFQLSPQCPDAVTERGYISLPATWVTANPSFTLSLPLQPRWVTQGVSATTFGLLSLVRGPIVYCVEDVDNPWVMDHFKVRRLLQTIKFPSELTSISDNFR